MHACVPTDRVFSLLWVPTDADAHADAYGYGYALRPAFSVSVVSSSLCGVEGRAKR